MIGRTLGNYRIMEQIGMGGMATVYKAYDPDTDRYVAIKVLPEHFSKDPRFRQRFEREAKAIAKLEHIHILPLFAYGEDEGVAYMVMRYLDAGSLTERIRQGALPLAEAGRLLSQIASALDHAHAHGVLHRDVKPSNVLLDSSGNAFLMDFGIAKMVESTLDLTGASILGTPAYMSPEQCRGAELTSASDQYSLGIILYEMVTGRTPFRAETPIALIHMQLNEPLPLPRQVMPGLPEEAERVILKALTKDPSLRFPTCGDMAAAFARAVASVTVEQPAIDDLTIASAAPPAVTTPAVEEVTALHGTAEQVAAAPRKRRRLPAWAIGLMAVVVVLGLAAVAIVAGLRFFGEEEGGPVSTEEMATGPAEGMIEGSVEPPSEEPGISIEPPEESREVRPCDWEGQGSGLCIYAPPREKPIQKILEEAGLDLTGPGSWSPDGRQIAFSAVEPGGSYNYDTTIYIVNADGTDLTRLPQIGNDINPAWSPDGEWLVFHSNCGLAVMHPDGSEPSVLWSSEEDWCTEQPQWSPDGQSIVVSVLQSGGEAWTFPMDREVWVVTDEGNTLTPIAALTYNNDNCLSSEVAFSPDGTQVAYVDDMCQTLLANADGSGVAESLSDFPYWWTATAHPQWGGGEGTLEPPPKPISKEYPGGKLIEQCEDSKPPQLCVRDVKTDWVTQITDHLEFEAISESVWSPDGQQIVFNAGSDPDTGQPDHKLYIIKADGSDLKQITRGDTNDILPDWSPDGEWIAFHRNCGLWIIHPDGSDAKELLPGTAKFCALMMGWTPDSRQIAFLNNDETTASREIWVVNHDGTDPHVIFPFEPRLEPWRVAWSPDARQIICVYGDGGQDKVLLVNADGSGEPKLLEQDMIETLEAWEWFPDFWPRWGDQKEVLPLPPGESKGGPVPEDPWGHVIIPPGDPVNLAFVGALSGEAAGLGETQENAFLMAIEDWSNIKGFPIEAAIIADDGCTDEGVGQQVAQEVVSDPSIVGLVGHSCSPSCRAGAPVYEEAHLVLISPSCTASDLTEQSLEMFNRVVVRDDRGGDELNFQIVDSPTYQEFANRYQDRYGQPLPETDLGPLAAYAYDATAVLIQAIEVIAVVDEAGNLVIGRQALAEAVRRTPGYEGVTGVIDFDDKGDRQLP